MKRLIFKLRRRVAQRVYEATGKTTPNVRLKLNAKIASAHEANLLGVPGQKLQFRNDTLQFDLHPFEIKTSVLELARGNKH